MHKLLVYTSKDNGTLPRGEKAETSNRRLHILNAVGQMLGLPSPASALEVRRGKGVERLHEAL